MSKFTKGMERQLRKAGKEESARKKFEKKTESRLSKFRKKLAMAYHGKDYHAATSKSSIRRKAKPEKPIESPHTKAVADKGLRRGNALSAKEAASVTDTRKKKGY